MIKRTLDDIIKDKLFKGKAIVIMGPRQVGKTTLLNAIVWEIPRENRLLLVQNPTEIMIYERSDETGAKRRDCTGCDEHSIQAGEAGLQVACTDLWLAE